MKKRLALLLTLIVACSLIFCCCSNNVDDNRNRRVNSVCHRGYGDAPENTLAAFRTAKAQGFDAVECDVRFTKDGVAVLLHDRTVNRTSNGRGRISDMTYDEVRKLDFGSWKSSEYANTRIPTFSEFVGLCVELDLHPYIEIKNGATAEQVRYLVDVIENASIEATWIARKIEYLSQVSQFRPDDRLGLIADVISGINVKALVRLDAGRNVCFMDANYSFLTSPQISLCKKYCLPLEVWTLDNVGVIRNIDPYISGVTSNFLNAEKIFSEL
ncbi:MAG: hypothetical protein NC099_04795 [Corallococcus sp.]|nr:hypothetical protein [Corallococcus sp.]